MTISYVPTVKSARMQAVIAAIDASASPGSLEIGTSGMGTVLVSIMLEKPSFSEDGEGVLTLLGTTLTANATAAGKAAAAQILNGAGAQVATGLTVGLPGSGADIQISNTTIAVGDAIPIDSLTITSA
jgi:hypothetical protein